jgi:hypothetical protein
MPLIFNKSGLYLTGKERKNSENGKSISYGCPSYCNDGLFHVRRAASGRPAGYDHCPDFCRGHELFQLLVFRQNGPERDILIGTIAATMAGAIMMLASMARWSAIFGGMRSDDDEGGLGIVGLIAMSVIVPMAAMLIQMAISRSREYLADSTGAVIAGRPDGLARALEKLASFSRTRTMDANPSTAHMFIVNPPVAQRVARLTGSRPAAPRSGNGPGSRLESDGAAFWDRLSK